MLSTVATTLQADTVITGDVAPPLPWDYYDTKVTIGETASGTLTVDAGSVLFSRLAYLGRSLGSSGEATVTGSGSRWANLLDISIGDAGNGILIIQAGGTVDSDVGYLGYESGSTGQVTVSGDTSAWNNDGTVVGHAGRGTLTIQAGGIVRNTEYQSWSHLGYAAGSTGTVSVTGSGSEWNNAGYLYVGHEGSGSLTVADGGAVSAGTFYASLDDLHGDGTILANGAILDADLKFNALGGNQAAVAFGSGGMLRVTASGGGQLGAGYRSAGTLTVADGVSVAASRGILGLRPGSTGEATVTGNGSQWTNISSLFVGYEGTGKLTIDAGGTVSNLQYQSRGYLGYTSGSTGMVSVTGRGSQWNNRHSLTVGQEGSGALTIEAGGTVNSAGGELGSRVGAMGVVTLDGNGSQWNSGGSLYVGREGSGKLTIKPQGIVSIGDSYLGYESGSIGEAMVSGSGSEWNSTGHLSVGHEGSGALTIEAGGTVTTLRSVLGYHPGSTGEATVTGNGSQWHSDEYFSIGSGRLTIEDGGAVSSSLGGGLAVYPDSTGVATVTGAGSQWNSGQWLSVGNVGTGSLIIEAGGTLSSSSGAVASAADSVGEVRVTGTGSEWQISKSLRVGDNGSGTVLIEAGGKLRNSHCNMAHAVGSSGVATVTGTGSTWESGGNLNIGFRGDGTLNITHGGVVSVAGTLTVDSNSYSNGTIQMSTGGRLALYGEADGSLLEFLELVEGTDSLRYWDTTLSDWAPITDATYGDDYTLEYLTEGGLAGYTLLTVGTLPPSLAGDYNNDGMVNLADYTVWRDHLGSADESAIHFNGDGGGIGASDYEYWRSQYGMASSNATESIEQTVPEPASLLLMLILVTALSICGRELVQ